MSEAMIQSLGEASAKLVMLERQLAESKTNYTRACTGLDKRIADLEAKLAEAQERVEDMEGEIAEASKPNLPEGWEWVSVSVPVTKEKSLTLIDGQCMDIMDTVKVKAFMVKYKELEAQLAEKEAQIDTAAEMISEGLENEMSREQILIDVEEVLKGAKV